MEHPLPTRTTEPDPKPERPVSERARRARQRNLEKGWRAQAKKCRARKRARRKEQARLEKQRRRQERAQQREAERWERGLQKRLARGREHGFFLFRTWCLFVIPFTSTLKRLGESVDGFRRLAERFECWLVPGLVPAAGEVRDGTTGLRSPSWFRWIAQKVARALAQVVWLEERYIRLYAREQAIRLEARLKVAAEMQATLRGEQGPEAQAELEGKLAVLLGLTAEERRQAPPEEKVDGLCAIWPARFGRRLAEVILDAVMDGPERRWNLTRLRCRVELLLAAHRTAEELVGCRLSVDGGRLTVAGERFSVTTSASNATAPTDNRQPTTDNRPATDNQTPSSDNRQLTTDECAELRVKILELEQKVRELRQLERIAAGVLDAPQIEELKGHKKRLQAQIGELRAWRRKLKQLAQVESQSVETLGNPKAHVGAAGVHGTNPPAQPGQAPPLFAPEHGPPNLYPSAAPGGRVPEPPRPETRLAPIEPGEIDARVDPYAACENLRQEDLKRAEMPPDERERAEERDRSLAAKRGLTVAVLRRARAEQEEAAPVLLRWQRGSGLELKMRNWRKQRWTRVGQTAVAGEEAWWPEARELELTVELRARRKHEGTSLGYTELKRLLAAALGLTPVRKRAPVAAPGVSTLELNRALEGVARLLWTTVGIEPRRAARRLGELAGAGRTMQDRIASRQTSKPSAESDPESLLEAFQRTVDGGCEIEGGLQSRGGFETRPYSGAAGIELDGESEIGAETEGGLQSRGGFETRPYGGAAESEIAEPESNARSARLYVAFGRLLVAMHGNLPEFYAFRPDVFRPHAGGEEE